MWAPKIQQLTPFDNTLCNIKTIHTSICSFPAFIYTCCLETLSIAVNLSSDCRGSFLTPTKLRTKCAKELQFFKQSSVSLIIFTFPQWSNTFLLLYSVQENVCVHAEVYENMWRCIRRTEPQSWAGPKLCPPNLLNHWKTPERRSHRPRVVPHLNVSLEISSILRVGDGEEEGRLATANSCLNDGMLMPFRLWLLSMEQFYFKSRTFWWHR